MAEHEFGVGTIIHRTRNSSLLVEYIKIHSVLTRHNATNKQAFDLKADFSSHLGNLSFCNLYPLST